MPNNNTEATTYVAFAEQASATFSYAALSLSSSITDNDQLEVVRAFTWNSAIHAGGEPNAEELKTVHTLPNSLGSGSLMYSIDTTAKTITFSDSAVSYKWLNTTHHSRGTDITLPVYALGDVVTIRRKTPVNISNQQWVAGAKVTSGRLNAQNTQLLHLAQELRSFVLNPKDFDTYIGKPSGICPLDANQKIPYTYIPASLGGTPGEPAVNISSNTLDDLGDVSTGASAVKTVLIYNNSTAKWEPKAPLDAIVNLGGATAGDALRWDGSNWELAALSLGDIDKVVITGTPGTGEVLFYNGTNWVNNEEAAASNDLLIWNGTKWNPTAYNPAVQSTDLATHSLTEMADVTVPDVYSWTDGDILIYSTDLNNKWRPKAIDIFDLNNVKDDVTLPAIANGDILYYNNDYAQANQGNLADGDAGTLGCFTWGAPFSGITTVNPATAATGDVIHWISGSGWALDALTLGQMKDVDTTSVDTGDMLQYDSNISQWVIGPSTAPPLGGALVSVSATYDYTLVGNWQKAIPVNYPMRPVRWYIHAGANCPSGSYSWDAQVCQASVNPAYFDNGWGGTGWYDLNTDGSGGTEFECLNQNRWKNFPIDTAESLHWWTAPGTAYADGRLAVGDIIVLKPTNPTSATYPVTLTLLYELV
jgi:hypothetical protein